MWDFLQRDWLLRTKPTPDAVEAREFLEHMNKMMGTSLAGDCTIIGSFRRWNEIFRERETTN